MQAPFYKRESTRKNTSQQGIKHITRCHKPDNPLEWEGDVEGRLSSILSCAPKESLICYQSTTKLLRIIERLLYLELNNCKALIKQTDYQRS